MSRSCRRVKSLERPGWARSATPSSSAAKDPDAAWDVLHYTFTDGMTTFMESYLLVPPIKSFYEDPAWQKLPGPPYANEVFVKAMDDAMLPPSLALLHDGAVQPGDDGRHRWSASQRDVDGGRRQEHGGTGHRGVAGRLTLGAPSSPK